MTERCLTAVEASNLANEYKNLWRWHHPENERRAMEILRLLREHGYGDMARAIRDEG